MSSLNALQLLLKAPSKKIVDGIFVGVFRSRESPINQTQINDVVQVLSCSDEEAKEVLPTRSLRTDNTHLSLVARSSKNFHKGLHL